MEATTTDAEADVAVTSPTPAEARALHQRLLDGSRSASSDVAGAYVEPLVRRLRRKYPNVDEHLWHTSAADALISYIKHPSAYDPARLDLEAYLFMAASRDLLNELAKQRRHLAHAVELSAEVPERRVNEFGDPARYVEQQEAVAEALAAARRPLPERVSGALTPVEASVIELIRDRVRRTSEYAAVMGITHLPPAKQRRRVNRMKDKLKKRIDRAGSSDGRRA